MPLLLGLQFILNEQGISATINHRKDKTAINLREIYGCLGSNQYKKVESDPVPDDGTIRSIQEVTHYYKDKEGFVDVYDINTDDGTFVCGLGGIIAHNTDCYNKDFDFLGDPALT